MQPRLGGWENRPASRPPYGNLIIRDGGTTARKLSPYCHGSSSFPQQVHRSSEPWTHTLGRVCGDSRAAVRHNSTMCASARAQVWSKITQSCHCIEESISAIQNLQLVRLQSETRALCVCCLRGWLRRRRRSALATSGQARVRRRRQLAEYDAKERRRRNGPALLCLFGVIAFASELVVSGCRRLTRACR